MEGSVFDILKVKTQIIIDLIEQKNFSQANLMLAETSELLDEIIDSCETDEDLIICSKYQVLLNQLFMSVNS